MHRLHHGDHHRHHDSHNDHHGNENQEDLLNKLGREVYLFGTATASGALTAAQNRWKHDPVDLCMEAGSAAVVGIVCGVLAEAAPVLAAGAGTYATVTCLRDIFNPRTHAERNKALSSAWNGVWNSDSKARMNYYKQKLARQVGDETFDLALCTGFGTAGFASAEAGLRSGIMSQLHPQLRLTPSPVREHAVNAVMRRVQISGSNSSGMKDFVEGDNHGLDRGRLSLHPEPLMAYENAARIPNPDGRLGLRHYVHPVEVPVFSRY